MEEFREMLPKGQVSKIHTVEPTDPLALGVEITATGHKNTDVAILNKAEINYRDETIRMRDRNGRALLLRLKYAESKHRGTKISIYCPFVMVDRSTLGLQVKPKGGSRDFSAGSNPNSNVFLFSFPEFDEASSRAVVRVGDSDWSRVSFGQWQAFGTAGF